MNTRYIVNACVASGGWVPMGQGGCNLNYTPRRRNTHRPTNSQPSHRPPAPIPPLYHPSHLGQKPSGSKMNKPPKQGKKTGKEGETLNSRKRREENQEKRYATRTPRHANKAPSTTQTQPRHMTCARAKATYRWTGICPPLMFANNNKRYKRKHIHATALQTANTPPKNAKNTRDHSFQSLTTLHMIL